MTLQELNTALKENSNIYLFFVFKNSENSFLSNQYINEIARVKKLSIVYIDSLNSVISDKEDLFGVEAELSEDCLYVYKTDNLTEEDNLVFRAVDVNRLIIVCNKISADLKKFFSANYLIEMPKLEDWQIKDYVYSKADGVAKERLDWLISICNNDIYRIDNELQKLSLFNKCDIDTCFIDFANDGIFSDLSSSTIFNLTTAIMNKDTEEVSAILSDIDNFDCDPFALLTILLNDFKSLLILKEVSNASAELLGISAQKFYYLSKNYKNKFSGSQLEDIYRELTGVDYLVKSGELPAEEMLSYIINKIFFALGKKIS